MTRNFQHEFVPTIGILLALTSATSAQKLDPPVAEAFQQDVAWSPDGQWIAFSELIGGSEYDPANWSISVARADGTDRTPIATGAMWPSWSPDGTKLVFAEVIGGRRALCTARRDGADKNCFAKDMGKVTGPSWSPRGDRIAFAVGQANKASIYTADPDGSHPQQISSTDAADFNPQWSRDGKQIVFYREVGDGKDQIILMNSDGSGEKRLTEGKYHNIFPAFDHEDRIVLQRTWAKDDRTIARLDPKTGSVERLDNIPGYFARWSPDGKRVAFIVGRWPQSAIYVADANGENPVKVVN